MRTFVQCAACGRFIPIDGSVGVANLNIVRRRDPHAPSFPPGMPSGLVAAITGKEPPPAEEYPFCEVCADGLLAAAKSFATVGR